MRVGTDYAVSCCSYLVTDVLGSVHGACVWHRAEVESTLTTATIRDGFSGKPGGNRSRVMGVSEISRYAGSMMSQPIKQRLLPAACPAASFPAKCGVCDLTGTYIKLRSATASVCNDLTSYKAHREA